jgi:cytochrome c oxidase cbb3-type subunit 3
MSSQKNDSTKLHVEEDEKHLLLDHDYDGIQELNHPLPRWWNVIFYVSIVFGVFYFVKYQFLNAPNLREEFKVEYGKVLEAQAEYKRQTSAFKPDMYAAVANPEGVKKGEEVFVNNCLPCHAEKGAGDVGPNLTDKHWLVAKGTPETIYNVVYNGSEENGMPPWNEVLSSDEMYLVVSYVMSIKHTFQKGKEPEGELIED